MGGRSRARFQSGDGRAPSWDNSNYQINNINNDQTTLNVIKKSAQTIKIKQKTNSTKKGEREKTVQVCMKITLKRMPI